MTMRTKLIRPADTQPTAPAWMVTYGDCMGLLLAFFVLLFSMSEVKRDHRFLKVMQSIQQAFGGEGDASTQAEIQRDPMAALLHRLQELEEPDRPATETKREGRPERETRVVRQAKFQVRPTPDGLHLVLGGAVAFEPFSAVLKPEAKELIARAAERLYGFRTRLLVRGHAAGESLPKGSIFEDVRDLSYARAKAVALEMERNGIRRVRLIPVAVGDNEPLSSDAESPEQKAANGRVEVLVTEDLVDDGGAAEAVND